MISMSRYLILGGGKFGRLALERLGRQDTEARFLIVDYGPVPLLVEEGLPAYQQVQAEAITFLVQQLRGDSRWDWIIPMVPVHVAYHWLMKGPLAESGWHPTAVPATLEHLVRNARRGLEGELYLSRARHLCPDDCAEPDICPVTDESRLSPLYQELASLILPGYQLRVIPSRQLAPGVGGYSPVELLYVARNLKALTGNILIVTACRCHGVIHGLAHRSGRQSV
jgi:hypothetical protein